MTENQRPDSINDFLANKLQNMFSLYNANKIGHFLPTMLWTSRDKSLSDVNVDVGTSFDRRPNLLIDYQSSHTVANYRSHHSADTDILYSHSRLVISQMSEVLSSYINILNKLTTIS